MEPLPLIDPGGDSLERAANALRGARRVVALTGAGVSAESGAPTFRDAQQGLWARFDPAELATPEAFARDPEVVSRWYDERRLNALRCEPNAAHAALADLERRVLEAEGDFTLLTQNVDRLHHRAGSARVVELHGTLCAWRCTKTGEEVEPGPEAFKTFPPMSPAGAPMRPGVVWFGEALPSEAVEAAMDAIERCDVFLSIGTSAVVHPAAGFIHDASRRGATTIEVNLEPTPITEMVDHALHGRAGEILPALVDRAFSCAG
jgi:NAD-dependent deacetylase